MGSRASQRAQVVRHVAELPDQLGVAEFAGRGIPRSAERDRAGAAGLAARAPAPMTAAWALRHSTSSPAKTRPRTDPMAIQAALIAHAAVIVRN